MKKGYEWLRQETAPKLLLEFLKIYGTQEILGAKNNPVIMDWAKELGLEKVFTADSIPWCGLAMAVVAKRAGYEVVESPLWARSWSKFGIGQSKAMLGDVLVFSRGSAGHVGIYVGEDANCYHVLGGNQSDAVGITRIMKDRCIAIRRSDFKVGQPTSVRVILLKTGGAISTNEA